MKKFIIVVLSLALLGIIFITPDIPTESLIEKYCDDQSKFMELQGMEVHYKIQGDGPPVVLIHGTASSLHTWDIWTLQLESQFKVIRLDLPGFGITGPNTDHNYSIDKYTQFLRLFIDQLNLDTVYLAGNSLGGGIAWNYAQEYPDQVKKLILIDASGLTLSGDPTPTLAFQVAKIPVLNTLLTQVTPKYLHRKSILEVYADPDKVTDSLVTRYYELMLRPGNRRAFVDRINSESKPHPRKFIDIPCPTLIQWGAIDRWIPVRHALVYDSLIDNSQMIIYEDAGHVPMEEIPIKTVKDAINFLKEN